jgi:hypothetical protein
VRSLLGVLAVVPLLVVAGCAADPVPPGPDEAEIRAQLAQLQQEYWKSVAPNEPMPVIEPLEYVPDYRAQSVAVASCLAALELPGVTVYPDGTWTFSVQDVDGPALEAIDRAQWTCSQRYPIDPASPDLEYFLSDEQAAYLYDYYVARLIPCLEEEGHTIMGMPTREQFLTGPNFGWPWSPYLALFPTPTSHQAWDRLDAVCPRPPVPIQSVPYPDVPADEPTDVGILAP